MLLIQKASCWLGITAIVVLAHEFSAQAQRIEPKLGLRANSHAISQTSDFRLAQVNTSPDSTPSDNSNPASSPTPTAPAPVTPSTPAPATPNSTTTNFPDVTADYWAAPFIQGLAAKNVIIGFPDGSFRPEQPVTRAEFAAMLQKAFSNAPVVRQLGPNGFADVPPYYWGAGAIKFAYEAGFMAGYPNNLFEPNQVIPKVQGISGVANGLNLTPQGSATAIVNSYYIDAAQIPTYALNQVAAATQNHLVVNYPDVKVLNPQTPLTRAGAAALLYQALVQAGQLPELASNVTATNYIVGGPSVAQITPRTTPPTPTPPTPTTTATGGTANYSYFGGAVNFGPVGETALGNLNFTVISKIRLFKNISFRPAVVIGGKSDFLLPLTYDLSIPSGVKILGKSLPITPYLGVGAIIPTGTCTSAGPLVTGGVDYPINSKLTATLGVNAGWPSGGDTQFGVWLGVGYNFGFTGL